MDQLYSTDTLTSFARRAFTVIGLLEADAAAVAALTVEADPVGADAHGIFRLSTWKQWWRLALREDPFYRLKGVVLRTPPFRDGCRDNALVGPLLRPASTGTGVPSCRKQSNSPENVGTRFCASSFTRINGPPAPHGQHILVLRLVQQLDIGCAGRERSHATKLLG